MPIHDDQRLQSLIEWHFTVAEQNFSSRFGEYAGGFWKQYLPAGIPVPAKHPPKRIPEELFRRAERAHKRILS